MLYISLHLPSLKKIYVYTGHIIKALIFNYRISKETMTVEIYVKENTSHIREQIQSANNITV